MRSKDVEVSILVNGVPLEEYKPVHKNNGSLAECWIIGEPDTNYEVSFWNRNFSSEAVDTYVYVDGRKKDLGGFHLKQNEKGNFIGPLVKDGTARLPMKFGAIVHSAEGGSSVRDKDQNLAELSSIRVVVWRTRKIADNYGARLNFVEDTTVISEKAAKKSGRFCDTMTKFGPSVQVARTHSVNTKRLDAVPWVEFKFSYGSRGVLESQDVIPVEYQPEPATNDDEELEGPEAVLRAVEGLSADKRAKVVAEMTRRFGVKREGEASGSGSRKAPRLNRQGDDDEEECIDLTGDD
ncbi:hypothetical protein DFS34DRAFT_603094 [Phlyctochytrium arcticum]|nr:hypothetical protein DFS34DRAFT_603094 [Phlyctochytrium arcticum]